MHPALREDLSCVLEKMSPEQVASWGICLLSDCFSSIRRKVKWNPFALFAWIYLEKRSLSILRLLVSGKKERNKSTLIRIRKVRRLVVNLESFGDISWRHWNCVYAFFVEYECGYECLFDAYPNLAKECFRQLAEMPEKLASVIGEDQSCYLLKMTDHAKRISFVQGG